VIKAIETRYKGYRFRSRLEARWAVFFDALGVRWEYEKEGYDLGEHGLYLPDFWLPDQDCWVEIKGSFQNQLEQDLCEAKIKALCIGTKKQVVLFVGPPWDGENVDLPALGEYYDYIEGDANNPAEAGYDFPYMWCDCATCGAVGIEFSQRNDRLCQCSTGDRYHDSSPTRIPNALREARAARFEHGETPGVRR